MQLSGILLATGARAPLGEGLGGDWAVLCLLPVVFL